MTRQEQIEKMAVIGCVRNPQAHTAEECAKCDFKQGQCNAYRHAEELYNAGYRKIDKDSVVLSKEEYEMLANKYKNLEIKYSNLCDNYRLCKDANETLKQNVITARKETAKEIEKLKADNARLTTKLGQVLLSIDTVKEMNVMCNIAAQVKQAKIDVLNELKKKKSIVVWDIDEMIAEYENE